MPLGDYAEDVDALSGGGYTQHRVGVSGALLLDRWTVSGGAVARFRAAEPDELAVAYGRTLSAQLRLDRVISKPVSVFGSVGASSATLAQTDAYLDLWAWAGVTWRSRTGSWAPAAR